MLTLYHVIEYGHRTSFVNHDAKGADMVELLTAAATAAAGNGGNLTSALEELNNESGIFRKLPPQTHSLRRLDTEEAGEYNRDFEAGQDAMRRVTVDLDSGRLRYEHSGEMSAANSIPDGEYKIPPTAIEAIQKARQAPAIRLKDLLLLGLPPANVYMVHKQSDVGTVPASGLRELTGRGCSEFADLLSAKVDSIRPGAYGVELVMTGICPERLVDFDRAQVAMLRARPYSGLFQPEDQCPEKALQAVKDYLCFERDSTQIWPWFLSAEEMLGDESKLREIGAALRQDPEHGYDTEEIHQALTGAFGVNPALEQGRGLTMAP